MAYPKWLTRTEGGTFVVDTDFAYPLALAAIPGGDKPDQYTLEVAYQCIKMTVQDLIDGQPEDPRNDGDPLVLLFESGIDKQKWAHARHPKGRGKEAASQGREARNYRKQIKAKLLASA